MSSRQRILAVMCLAVVLATVVGSYMFKKELDSAREKRDAAVTGDSTGTHGR